MNEDDEIMWADSSSRVPLTCASTHVNCTEPYSLAKEYAMNYDASRLGLRPVGEICETTCSHRTRKRIKRGIVWQVAYGIRVMHPEGLAASLQSSNHSEHLVVSSFPMTPYTH
jgi:hypothetical protein